MSSLLWINEVKVYSGWHLETLFIWRWIFTAVWRQCLQQSSHSETWAKNLFWQTTKVVNWWNVRRELILLCPSKFNSFVNIWYHPPWHLYFCLTSAAIPLFPGWLILFNSSEGFDSIYPLLKDIWLSCPNPPNQFILRKAFSDLYFVASRDVSSLPLKASLLQVS